MSPNPFCLSSRWRLGIRRLIGSGCGIFLGKGVGGQVQSPVNTSFPILILRLVGANGYVCLSSSIHTIDVNLNPAPAIPGKLPRLCPGFVRDALRIRDFVVPSVYRTRGCVRPERLLSPASLPGFPKWEDFGAGPNSAKYLTPSLSDDPEPVALLPFNADDGAYVAFSTQWERAFQSKSKLDPIELKLHLVRRGMNELVLAQTWAAHYVGLASARELDMI
ncbi:hypothetical protein B0H17DRAFT_1135471 [Mycena rosella]|uniref:Uncharacterized protein n=1 Tax=Mycena rosella TaxID=1033263 RepID=A0AAD7GHV3_MYCRO|nr:hypothetical protein B0H17DRAFT_1135471 [Mycena rosella]